MTKPQRITELMPHQLTLEDGRSVELLDIVGKGTSTVVHRGLLQSANGLTRPVAVKVWSAMSSDEAEEIFESVSQMARAIACIEHPNVVRVYECGQWRGQPFLIEELVDGVALSVLQASYASRRQRLPLDLALFLVSEIAQGLSGARVATDFEGLQLGLVHHGICAREVQLSWRGDVKVADFGASLAIPASSSIRSLRNVASRAASLAPEVAQGALGDARSDVFSLGVLVRELLVGPRFAANVTNSEAIRLAREGYVEPINFQPHLPESLKTLIDRALAIDPEERYPTTCAMAFELRRTAYEMGAGDGRYFLQRALERQWPERAEEITAEHLFRHEPTEPLTQANPKVVQAEPAEEEAKTERYLPVARDLLK